MEPLTAQPRLEAWPFMIGTSLHEDYHVIVAPEFMIAHGVAAVLRNAIYTGSQVTPADQATVTVIRGLRMEERATDLYVVFRGQMIPRAASAQGARDATGTTESRGVKILAGLIVTMQYASVIEEERFSLSGTFFAEATVNQWLEQYWSQYQLSVPPPPAPSSAIPIPAASPGEARLTLIRAPDFDASSIRIRTRPAPQSSRPVSQPQLSDNREHRNPSAPEDPLTIDPPVAPSESEDSKDLLWIVFGGLGVATLVWLLSRWVR